MNAATDTAAVRRRATLVAVFVAIGTLIGVVYSLLSDGGLGLGAAIGASIAGGIAAFEVGYVHHPRGRWLRRQPLALFIALSAVVWVSVMIFSLQVLPLWLGDSSSARYAEDGAFFVDRLFRADMLFSVAVGLIMTATMRLRSLVGGRLLFEFLTGRYRRPVDERRIFLFLDLCDSTAIAEALGSVGYHAFLRDFIETLEHPIAQHGGEIYQYVGDEIVATWPVGIPEANGRVIRCHVAMEAAIAHRRTEFASRHGHVPTFRSGVHCGDVVAGEIGERRRQIVFVGDVVNTAARVEATARERGARVLVSDALLALTTLPRGVTARSIGPIRLKGKAEALELYELDYQTAAREAD
ncbi:MAG: adenylate/guanylate cyclase domain-containing protein [Pseudomonadota bacterium]